MPSTSRWLVGSSSTSRSCSPTSAAASATRRRSPPDSGPTGRSSASRPARSPNSPASTSRTRGVAGPLVRRAVADDQRRARSPPGRRSSRCADRADAQPAGVGDPAGVRRLAPGEQPQQRGLAAAVAADDADPVALADAERDVVEQGAACRSALLTRLQVDQVAGATSAAVASTTRAPATGPCARFTARQVPLALSATAMSIACSGSRARKTHGRPGAGDEAPSAPASSPASSVCRSAGPQRAGGRLQVVAAARRRARRVAGAQRGHQRVGRPAARAPAGRRAAGRTRRRPSGVDSPPSASATTQCEACPGPAPGSARSPRPVPSAVPPTSANGTSLPSCGGQLEQLVAAQAGAPQRVAGDQRGGRVGAAAGHPAGDRDPLGMCSAHVRARGRLRSASSQRGARPRGWSRPAARRRPATPSAVADGDRQRRRTGGDDLVVERDRVVDGGQVVVAVAAQRPADRELQVDLRRARARVTELAMTAVTPIERSGPRRSVLGQPGERPRRRAPRPGRRGSMPAARSAARRPAGDPAQPASAARSVLRRWAKAASTTAKTSARVAVVGRRLAGGSSATRPESTLGAGQKTVRPHRSGAAHVGVPGGLHRRHAVDPATRAARPAGRRPRPAPSPAPVRDGREAARAGAAAPAPRRCRAGSPPARWAAGRAAASSRSASAVTTVSRSAYAGARARDGHAAARAASTGSISTATTVRPRAAAQGQRAEAGPDLDDARRRRATLGGAHDAAHGVGVDDEVLPERLGRADAEPGGELADLGRAEQRGRVVAACGHRQREQVAGRRPATARHRCGCRGSARGRSARTRWLGRQPDAADGVPGALA